MIGLKLEDVKRKFFETYTIIEGVQKAKIATNRWFGGYVRKVARSSIKRATGKRSVSRPGEPPVSHTDQLKDNIFFAQDDAAGVVIGPIRLNQAGHYELTSGTTVPEVLEKGGTIAVHKGRSKRTFKILRRITIAARPFMAPAFEISKKKLPDMWADSINNS